jgi:hypothetical protein
MIKNPEIKGQNLTKPLILLLPKQTYVLAFHPKSWTEERLKDLTVDFSTKFPKFMF